jgi:nitrate/nitrite transporter NarK
MFQLAAFCLAAFGAYGTLPVFWSMPGDYLLKEQAAVGIAFINCVGALSGLVAPWLIGVIRQQTGSFKSGLLAVTACAAISLITMWLMPIAGAKTFPKIRQSVKE